MTSSNIPTIYQDKDTFVHHRDPRVKIILFVLLAAYVLIAPSWEWMAIALILCLFLAVLARTPWRWLLVLWALHLPAFIVILGIPLVRGAFEGSFSDFVETAQGSIRLILAWTATIVLGVTLISTMDGKNITQGVRGLRLPPLVALSVQLTYRLLYTLMSEALRIANGMRMKGVPLNPKHPLQFVWNSMRVAVPVTVAVISRAPTLMSVIQMEGIHKELPELGNFDLWDTILLLIGLTLFILSVLDAFGVLPFSVATLTPF
jgi:energy-coupling factor transport system permease protein